YWVLRPIFSVESLSGPPGYAPGYAAGGDPRAQPQRGARARCLSPCVDWDVGGRIQHWPCIVPRSRWYLCHGWDPRRGCPSGPSGWWNDNTAVDGERVEPIL